MEEVYDLDMRVQDILRPEGEGVGGMVWGCGHMARAAYPELKPPLLSPPGEWITTTSSLQQQQAGVMLFQLKYGSWTFPDFGVLQSWALNPVARAQALEVAGRGKGSRVQVQVSLERRGAGLCMLGLCWALTAGEDTAAGSGLRIHRAGVL